MQQAETRTAWGAGGRRVRGGDRDCCRVYNSSKVGCNFRVISILIRPPLSEIHLRYILKTIVERQLRCSCEGFFLRATGARRISLVFEEHKALRSGTIFQLRSGRPFTCFPPLCCCRSAAPALLGQLTIRKPQVVVRRMRSWVQLFSSFG
eukprot:g7646.t1